MEKVIKSVQTVGLSGMKKSKINEIKIMGMSLPVYIIAAFSHPQPSPPSESYQPQS